MVSYYVVRLSLEPNKIHRWKSFHWRHNEGDASQITDVSIVYSAICSGVDQRKLQSSASLAFVCVCVCGGGGGGGLFDDVILLGV